MRERELADVASRTFTEARHHMSRLAVEYIDQCTVLIQREHIALLRICRERDHNSGATGNTTTIHGRRVRGPRNVDISNEGTHAIEYLDPVSPPITDINQAVVGDS